MGRVQKGTAEKGHHMRRSSRSFFVVPRLALCAWLSSAAVANQLTISWDDNSTDELGFKIERSVDGVNFASIANVAANVRNFSDQTVSASATYWYRVKAYDGTRESASSNVATATVPLGAVAPAITSQPLSQAVVAGSDLILSAAASGTPAPSFQWLKSGQPIPGAAGRSLTLSNVTAEATGTYTMVATNSAGTATSAGAVIVVNVGPQITSQPIAQSGIWGGSVSFSVVVNGSPAPSLQWRKDGVDLPGQTRSTLLLSSISGSDAGTYVLLATNQVGTIASQPAALTVVGVASSFVAQPSAQTCKAGSTVTFSVVVSGTPAPKLQWLKNGQAIAGANGTSFTLSSVMSSDAGSYSVIASNAVGSRTSAAALLTVDTPIAKGRLTRVSAQALSSGSSSAAIQLDFSIVDASKQILVRGIGPGLASFTTGALLTSPSLRIVSSGVDVATNDDWGSTAGLVDAFNRVGAFPIAQADAAILADLTAKRYVAVVAGKTSGLAMAEIYDADQAADPMGKISRLSARGMVTRSTSKMTVAFVISGETSVHFLVRAIGPSLAGVQENLPNPVLSIYSGSTLLSQNDNWGGGTALQSLFKLAGASDLPQKSKDAAMEITLPPGVYAAEITGNGAEGLASLEIFVIP